MRKTKTQLKQTALKLLPTNKELGVKPTRKQRKVATAIVETAVRVAKAKASLQGRTPQRSHGDLPEPVLPKLPKRNVSKYEALEDTFEKAGRTFRLVWRNAFAATYEVKVCDAYCFETFLRVFAEAAHGEIKGVAFDTPDREVFPSDRSFGATAWTDCTPEAAARRYVATTALAVTRFLEKQG